MGGPPWIWRRRRGGPGRPYVPRRLLSPPVGTISFIPLVNGVPAPNQPIYLFPDELEAYRLVYYYGLTQEEAAKKMGVSRGTLWRLLDSSRRKIAQALTELRPIVISAASREQS